jgi:hypothetical protein
VIDIETLAIAEHDRSLGRRHIVRQRRCSPRNLEPVSSNEIQAARLTCAVRCKQPTVDWCVTYSRIPRIEIGHRQCTIAPLKRTRRSVVGQPSQLRASRQHETVRLLRVILMAVGEDHKDRAFRYRQSGGHDVIDSTSLLVTRARIDDQNGLWRRHDEAVR